jgi:hypothetical protein
MIGPEFFASEAGQLAAVAKQFMEAAKTLDAAPKDRRRLLFRPTLALAGHGLEVMLKACIQLNGEVYPKAGREGHNIGKLWQRDVCEAVRSHVVINARLSVADMKDRKTYQDVPEALEIERIIIEYVEELGKLHGEGNYALRYPSDPNLMAPRTPFLVQTLWLTADDLVKQPCDFLVEVFRTRILPHCIAD